ncbi:MAG: hypothetical protein ABSD39_18020 [Terriglobales bacterium]|jgi:hypothetical protein
MRLKQNASTAVVVRRSWANLHAIRLFLRDRSPDITGWPAHESVECDSPVSPKKDWSETHRPEEALPDESHTILARVLDDTDERGLWIELKTKEHEKNPSVELQALLIPWHEVLAVVVGTDFTAALEKSRGIGAGLTTIGGRNGHSKVR